MEKTNEENKLIPIQDMIYEIRGLKVMIDRDLAELYRVKVKRLNEAVKRNIRRFPPDFMFQLTKDEFTKLVANCDHLQGQKFRTTMPFVFTEHGLLMLHIDTCDYKFYEYDETIGQIMETLNNLIEKPKPARRIGFGAD